MRLRLIQYLLIHAHIHRRGWAQYRIQHDLKPITVQFAGWSEWNMNPCESRHNTKMLKSSKGNNLMAGIPSPPFLGVV